MDVKGTVAAYERMLHDLSANTPLGPEDLDAYEARFCETQAGFDALIGDRASYDEPYTVDPDYGSRPVPGRSYEPIDAGVHDVNSRPLPVQIVPKVLHEHGENSKRFFEVVAISTDPTPLRSEPRERRTRIGYAGLVHSHGGSMPTQYDADELREFNELLAEATELAAQQRSPEAS